MLLMHFLAGQCGNQLGRPLCWESPYYIHWYFQVHICNINLKIYVEFTLRIHSCIHVGQYTAGSYGLILQLEPLCYLPLAHTDLATNYYWDCSVIDVLLTSIVSLWHFSGLCTKTWIFSRGLCSFKYKVQVGTNWIITRKWMWFFKWTSSYLQT